jgi:hypothetical protein
MPSVPEWEMKGVAAMTSALLKTQSERGELIQARYAKNNILTELKRDAQHISIRNLFNA